MSKMKDEKTIMLKALAPWKLITVYVWCMMHGDMSLLLLHINNHNQEKEHADITYGMDMPLM
jgi:hypothetical protein